MRRVRRSCLSETFNNGEEGEVFLAVAYNIVMSLWLHAFSTNPYILPVYLACNIGVNSGKKKSSTNSKHDKNLWTYIVWHAQLLYMVLLLVLVSILNDQGEWSWGTSTKFLQCMNISNLVFSLARKLFRSCVWSCTNPFWARGVWILDKIVKKNKENFHCIK